jgi:hypothetical protein
VPRIPYIVQVTTPEIYLQWSRSRS